MKRKTKNEKRKTVLAVDIGNTNITLGKFVDAALKSKRKIPSSSSVMEVTRAVRGILADKRRDRNSSDRVRVIISSVVPGSLRTVKSALKAHPGCQAFVLGENARVPIRNRYRVPEQVGQDRLVNAFAAARIYGAPVVVVDFGTGITFDCVSARGEYLGGLIMPGMRISLEALYEKTALLPKTELVKTRHIIGKTTSEGIRAGLLFGFGLACEGLIARYRTLFGSSLKIIATGGDAGLLQRYAPSLRIIDPDLTLKGLMIVESALKQ